MTETTATDRTACPHCGETVPPGSYCGHCGGHLGDTESRRRRRTWSFAAAPHEHVLQVTLVTTFFPHLPHRHTHAFRRLLLAGAVVVVVLAGLRLYTSATLATAAILPLAYLLYLNEVDAYRGEPLAVLGATFLTGIGFGVLYAHFLSPFLTGVYVGGQPLRLLLVAGIAAPAIALTMMAVGPLLLLPLRRFDESLDGLVFGVTSALGFSAAQMLVSFWPVVVGGLVGNQPADDWVLRLVRQGLFVFTVNAATTAAITSTLWLRRHGRARDFHRRSFRSLPLAVIGAYALQIGLGIASAELVELVTEVVVWGVGAAIALLYLRVVIHHALLEEGGELEIGPPSVCSECHHVVPTMLFCPSCGIARSAGPRRRTAPVPGTAPGAAAEAPS
jgi:rRNA maturation endonuclease Nob1